MDDLDDSMDSGNLLVRAYLPLIQKNSKDSITHIHGLAVYAKEGFPFTQDLFLENSVGSYLCFQLANFIHCLTSFSSINLFFFMQFFILFDIT